MWTCYCNRSVIDRWRVKQKTSEALSGISTWPGDPTKKYAAEFASSETFRQHLVLHHEVCMTAILGPQSPMVTEVINVSSSMAVDSPYCSKQRAAAQAPPQCSRMGLSGSPREGCPLGNGCQSQWVPSGHGVPPCSHEVNTGNLRIVGPVWLFLQIKLSRPIWHVIFFFF